MRGNLTAVGGGERRFFMKEGRLFTRRTGGSDEEVFPAGQDRFFYGPSTLTWFEVKRDPAGKHLMTMYQGAAQSPETATRKGPLPAEAAASVSSSVLERYAGSYRSERGTAKVAVGGDGALTIQVGRQSPRRLIPTSESEFRVDGMDATVVFHSTGGAVTHLTFEQGDHQLRADREP